MYGIIQVPTELILTPNDLPTLERTTEGTEMANQITDRKVPNASVAAMCSSPTSYSIDTTVPSTIPLEVLNQMQIANQGVHKCLNYITLSIFDLSGVIISILTPNYVQITLAFNVLQVKWRSLHVSCLYQLPLVHDL